MMYGGGSDERQNTLNQLLLEMDGFSENENVLVFGSTNVNKDGLDSALLRPGRFDREIYIDVPGLEERCEIFEMYLNKYQCYGETMDNIKSYASMAAGLTGADIETICNEAGIFAVRKEEVMISPQNVFDAIDRVIIGIQHDSVLTEREKSVVAYHESGHAICSHFYELCDKLLKISLVQKGAQYGYTRYLPTEKNIETFEKLRHLMRQMIGGRVAEFVKFGEFSTASENDLRRITALAYSAVSQFGFGSGLASYEIPGSERMTVSKPYGENMANELDKQVRTMVSEAFEDCEALLRDKMELLEVVAVELMDKEEISDERFLELVRQNEKEEESEV